MDSELRVHAARIEDAPGIEGLLQALVQLEHGRCQRREHRSAGIGYRGMSIESDGGAPDGRDGRAHLFSASP
jgi:hypothetical protein